MAEGGWIRPGSKIDSRSVVITAPRAAHRIDSHHAVFICSVCLAQTPFQRTDGEPLTNADIGNALAEIHHSCQA